LNRYIYHFLISFSILFLSFFSAKAEGTLEVMDSNGMVLSTETNDGILDFGNIDAMGLSQGNPGAVDGVFNIDASNQLVPALDAYDPFSGALYVIGASTSGWAMEINAQDLGSESSSDLMMSSTGELEIYISKSNTPWVAGVTLDDNEHPLLPDNDYSVVIKGNGGLLDPDPVTETGTAIKIDLGVKLLLENTPGSIADTITFTLISGSN
jgi:hypothetical protein